MARHSEVVGTADGTHYSERAEAISSSYNSYGSNVADAAPVTSAGS